jgi:predicted transcriptional regulator
MHIPIEHLPPITEAELQQLVDRGIVEKKVEDGKTFVCLTAKGWKLTDYMDRR